VDADHSGIRATRTGQGASWSGALVAGMPDVPVDVAARTGRLSDRRYALVGAVRAGVDRTACAAHGRGNGLKTSPTVLTWRGC
jgi:hypothetical protein